MPERRWLLLAYSVPRTPSASRVYVWRKLKRLGSIALQDAVWILPDTAYCKEQFRWLADEIEELGGQATLWEANLAVKGQEAAVVKQFEEQADGAYRQLLVSLKGRHRDLASLSRQFQEVQMRD